MPDEEKPKRTKSWSEIDKARDRSGGSRKDTRERETFQNSTGYTKYKTNLDRLFSGGGALLPEHLREKVDPGGEKAAEDETRKALYAIEDTKLFHSAAAEFLSAHEIPDDPRLLDRLLTHPDEEILEKALARLEELHRKGSLKVPPALTQRLSTVEIDSGDPKIRRRAADLRKAIR